MNPESERHLLAGKYEIESPLASGAMGAVYIARHAYTRNRVALKVLYKSPTEDAASFQRFLREVSFAAEIGHEGIVRVFDAGIDPENGSLYLAMELLEGESLGDRLNRGDVPRAQALRFVYELLDPLSAAHKKGIVHRDLKPENVYIARAYGTERIKLLDFGIARQVGSASATATGVGMGTPYYMSPEQAMSAASITPSSDVWAVGVLLYRILTGVLPFEGESATAVVIRAHGERHRPIRDIVPDTDPRLASLVDRCLAKRPEDRPRDAGAVRAELAPFIEGLSPADEARMGAVAPLQHAGSTGLGSRSPSPAELAATAMATTGDPGITHTQRKQSSRAPIIIVMLTLLVAGGAIAFFFTMKGGRGQDRFGNEGTRGARSGSGVEPGTAGSTGEGSDGTAGDNPGGSPAFPVPSTTVTEDAGRDGDEVEPSGSQNKRASKRGKRGRGKRGDPEETTSTSTADAGVVPSTGDAGVTAEPRPRVTSDAGPPTTNPSPSPAPTPTAADAGTH